MDTFTDIGKYFCGSTSIATSLINSPVTNDNFVMYVFKRTSGKSINQLIITLNGALYIRGSNSSGALREWRRKVDESEINEWLLVSGGPITGNIYPNTTNSITLGTSNFTFKQMYSSHYSLNDSNGVGNGALRIGSEGTETNVGLTILRLGNSANETSLGNSKGLIQICAPNGSCTNIYSQNLSNDGSVSENWLYLPTITSGHLITKEEALELFALKS